MAAPSRSPDQVLVSTMVRPVNIQMIMVSKKVPVILTSPCSAGNLVFAEAAAIGAEPKPASFENIPRATPKRIATRIPMPVAAPTPASKLKALFTISTMAEGKFSILTNITKRHPTI